ncbi:MAG: copper chaperone PCu(A)C [Oscillochloridaceae bacterium]|nr:copper chaperone PCu(A)C [Chloroflexaceae bacterium]MDW8389885.1 copper chaperone PCu(A)C [Oscillochloridaceae bacterium]
MRVTNVLVLILVGVALLAGCGASAPQISVNEPWVRAAKMTGMDAQGGMSGHGSHGGTDMTPPSGTSAAYMVLVNRGGAGDRLVSASTDVAEVVELHETKMVDNVMQMAPVTGGIPVPANGQVELKPGGLHVMLIGLKRDLAAGETVRLTLKFERAGEVTVDAPVRMP